MLSELQPRWFSQLRPPPDEAEQQLLSSWLPEIEAALSGKAGELLAKVALSAQGDGLSGRPASFSLGRLLPLRALLSDLSGGRALAERLLLLAADAHATGALQRAREAALAPSVEGAPILRLGPAAVGFAAGPLEAALVDPLLGRLLRFAVGQGCQILALELSAAGPITELFTRTLRAFEASDHPAEALWVFGARPNPPAGPWTRVRFAERLQPQLDAWLSIPAS